MRSIVYNGVDLCDVCSAEVVERAALPIVTDAMIVPGRAGALLVSGRIPPRTVRVRLFMDAGFKADVNRMADLRHRVYSVLYSTNGGTLRLPDEPEWEYRNVVCTDAGAWSSLFEDGHGEVGFTLFDPVAYGLERVERTESFDVGGTWPTWPEFSLVASAGSAVQVGYGGKFVRVERAFTGGEPVVIDCATESVAIGGVGARADVTLASDFFSMAPGNVTLAFSGCSSHTAHFHERWL
ncbi:MAG: phage tail family protein [Eggerthellaceae bacterium]|nr:phage tail family protein [Eggerthellaceae bacterium]